VEEQNSFYGYFPAATSGDFFFKLRNFLLVFGAGKAKLSLCFAQYCAGE